MIASARLDALAGLAAAADYQGIADLAAGDRLVLSRLLAVTFGGDDLTGWRAAQALGLASARVAIRDAEFVRNILRRLAWSLNDESGSVGWRSPQAMGAILAASPGLFPEFVPLVLALLDLPERALLPGTLWAIARMAEHGAGRLEGAAEAIRPLLGAPEPEVRGLAARCLGLLGDASVRSLLARLADDQGGLILFDGRELNRTTVGSLARVALAALGDRPPSGG